MSVSNTSGTGLAVVIGAGVMGAQIAAHLANAGWHAALLDVASNDKQSASGTRSSAAKAGLERARKARPPAFFGVELADRIRLGNIEDDLAVIAGADWVIEAVVEKPDIKRTVHGAIEGVLPAGAVVTTNTSGLSIRDMCADRSASYRSRFFGSHFFNPPRYMKLLELIPTADTDAGVLERFAGFSEHILGKRVAYARDTPGFIANRLGVYGMLRTIHAALDHKLTVEQIDYLTGPLAGHPRSATLRLSDIVGLDITADVAGNLRERLPDDRYRAALALPAPVARLLADGRIGEKAGAGFYRREPDRTIVALDFDTMEYRPRQSPAYAEVESVRALALPERLRRLVALETPAGQFAWETTRDLLCYAADIATEIADDIPTIDRACRWGFNWDLGPFETWDGLGVADTAKRLERDGIDVPAIVQDVLSAGSGSFYREEPDATLYFAMDARKPDNAGPEPAQATNHPLYRRARAAPEYLDLARLKSRGAVVKDTPDATLIDLADGVYCLEFHTKMNVLGPGIAEMIDWSLQEAERQGAALVVGNQGEHFSVGYNLQLLLMSVYDEDWDQMLTMGRQLQQILLRLKRSGIPAVAAPHGYTLGGGCEVMLHCAAVVAAAESYIGLPETGIGAIPGAGGTTEMLVRATACVPPGGAVDPYPYVHKVFETIGMAKVSGCADEAFKLGFRRDTDTVVMNSDRILHEAKTRAMNVRDAGYRPPDPAQVPVMGEDGVARFELELHIMQRSGYISEHDHLIGKELAVVLCGGRLAHPQTVTEEYLLGLESEAFVRLCSTPKTAARIKAMLETGKPLRN